MGFQLLEKTVSLESQPFFQSNLEKAIFSGKSIFPDGVNSYDLKNIIDNQLKKDFFLFALEGQKLIFSKAPIRGNEPYNFWVELRNEEIAEEIQYFNKINQTEKKSNMLNILLTIDRNGLGVNQLQTWDIFKKQTSKYITRIKRVLKERWGIESIGHFRVFEAHASGHCHAHVCLILKDCLDYELVYKYSEKSGRGSYSAELKDKYLKIALSQWHFANGSRIGKSSVSVVYSTERLINYLTKYYSKNQTQMKNSYECLVTGNYDLNKPTSNIKMVSDLKKVLGFYYAIKTNVRLFRHSIKKDERIAFLKSQEEMKENLLQLVSSGLDVKKVAAALQISEKRVLKLFYSMSHLLANETLNILHEDFKETEKREYIGIVSKKTLENAFDISNMGIQSAFQGIYENEISPEGKKNILENENIKKLEGFLEKRKISEAQIKELKDKIRYVEDTITYGCGSMPFTRSDLSEMGISERKMDYEKKQKTPIGFVVNLENMPVIQGYQTYKKMMESEGKKVSLGRYLSDFCTWKEKENRLHVDQIENQKLFSQIWLEKAKSAKKKKVKKYQKERKLERRF